MIDPQKENTIYFISPWIEKLNLFGTPIIFKENSNEGR